MLGDDDMPDAEPAALLPEVPGRAAEHLAYLEAMHGATGPIRDALEQQHANWQRYIDWKARTRYHKARRGASPPLRLQRYRPAPGPVDATLAALIGAAVVGVTAYLII